jgi:hypothetical protein
MASQFQSPPHRESAAAPAVKHETSDVDTRAVFVFGLALIIAAVLIHFLTWRLFMYFHVRESVAVTPLYPLALGQEQRLPPEPRLQVNPREDLRELRNHEDAVLTTYGWVDRNNAVVRIPIQKAMELTLVRGLSARQTTIEDGGPGQERPGTDQQAARNWVGRDAPAAPNAQPNQPHAGRQRREGQ